MTGYQQVNTNLQKLLCTKWDLKSINKFAQYVKMFQIYAKKKLSARAVPIC